MADNVIDVLVKDHREVEEMFRELETLRGSTDESSLERKKTLVEQATIELVRHSVAEEVIVYPTVSKKVSEEEVEHARKEHAEAEETMAKLEKLDPSDPGFDDELDTLMAEIRHHISDEEGEMFAHMRREMSEEELETMGGRVEAFKKVAPTRPHPSVPNEALPRLAAGGVVAILDRMRDLASGRGK
jgi:hemerythrin-like domain-containing protein